MALLDSGLKQRIVGALVLLALAVIFLPILLSREDELRHVQVDAPQMPAAPSMPVVELEPVVVPEPQTLVDEPLVDTPVPNPAAVSAPVAAAAATPVAPAVTPPEPKPVVEAPVANKLDANSLPISWSVQLASLSSREGAQALQKTLRSQGYNAYTRTFDGMNRVFVGPLIERAEANRVRDQLNRQHKLNGFVVRFQPETN